MKLHSEEYPAYFTHYISLVDSEKPLLQTMKDSFEDEIAFLKSIDETKKNFAYAEGKWTIGQVLQHLIDVELVMAHRAFRISRMDETDLPGFDHDEYARVADVSNKSLADLCQELISSRAVTLMHFTNTTEKMLTKKGKVSGNTMSVRALGYILIGHIKHHNNILKERYI